VTDVPGSIVPLTLHQTFRLSVCGTMDAEPSSA
jgi:hypothetical protein